MPKRTLISIVEDDQPFRESTKAHDGVLGPAEVFPSGSRFPGIAPPPPDRAWSPTFRCLE
jgi:hypothetical protein